MSYFNQHSGIDLTTIFDQYLRHLAIPTLELKFEPGKVSFRWKVDVSGFAMPVKVGTPSAWQTIHPTEDWQVMNTPLTRDSPSSRLGSLLRECRQGVDRIGPMTH